jgi:urease
MVFVSQSCVAKDVVSKEGYSIRKRVEGVKRCRGVTKKDMVLNSALPVMTVDPQTFKVTADGVHLVCEPAKKLPLTNRLFGLF